MVRCEAKDGKPFVTGALISCNSSTVQAHIVAVVHLYERNEQHEISITNLLGASFNLMVCKEWHNLLITMSLNITLYYGWLWSTHKPDNPTNKRVSELFR